MILLCRDLMGIIFPYSLLRTSKSRLLLAVRGFDGEEARLWDLGSLSQVLCVFLSVCAVSGGAT